MSGTYEITEDVYLHDSELCRSYGIAAYAESENDGTATILLLFNDITCDKERIEKLVSELNRLQLSVLHLRDVIEDFLADL